MTAQAESYGSGAEARLTNLLGEPWDRLFSTGEDDLPITPMPPCLDEVDGSSRLSADVLRLPFKEMALFGRCPETDPFVTVVCSVCDSVIMPHAFRRHMEKRHGDDSSRPPSITSELRAKTAKKSSPLKKTSKSASSSPHELAAESSPGTVCCSLCATVLTAHSFRRHVHKVHGDDPSAKPLLSATLKFKTAKKPTPPKKSSKSASSSPPELTEELTKDKKLVKIKKCKSPIPPELEPILPAAKRIVLTGSGPPELMPQELPKKPTISSNGSINSSKKKLERKADKVYDPNKHCGVINDAGKPCLRSILCKVHLVALKRAVQNRAMPYDALTKLLKSQNDEEKRPKVELAPPVILAPVKTEPPQVQCVLTVSASDWSEPPSIKQEEPPAKRLKTEELEEDLTLPSDLDALIDATLKDVEENEPLPEIPVVPRPEPILRWNLEAAQVPPASCSPPPHFQPEDILWHATHPQPLATHTYGCRLLGGLLSTNRKGYAFRKNVQSVLTSRSGFSDSSNKLPGFSSKTGSISPLKKNPLASATPKRKRKGSGGGADGSSPSPASDIITGLLQRAGQPQTNGVPLRLYQSTLPVQQPAFIQFNLCPSK